MLHPDYDYPITRVPSTPIPSPHCSTLHDLSAWVEGWLSRHPPAASPDARRIIWVHPNPHYTCKRGGRSLTSPSFYRFRELRPGRTIHQCLARGVTRRDIRHALRAGWLQLEVQS